MVLQNDPERAEGDCHDQIITTDLTACFPKRYLALHHLYSTTSPCVSASGSSNVMSKKVRARKLHDGEHFGYPGEKISPQLQIQKPPLISVYSRRRRKINGFIVPQENRHPSFLDLLRKRPQLREPVKHEESESSSGRHDSDNDHEDGQAVDGVEFNKITSLIKRRRLTNQEVEKLEVDSSVLYKLEGPQLRGCKDTITKNFSPKRKLASSSPCPKGASVTNCTKKWVRLNFDGVDPKTVIGLQCKIYWPLDGEWYRGCIAGYSSETGRHHVKYKDGDEEDLIISNEKVEFQLSLAYMNQLKLTYGSNTVDSDVLDYSEMVVLAACLDDSQDFGHGDIIWAKLTGHAMWPAIVVDESIIVGRSVLVQFFGSHDFARVKPNQVISFLRGLLSSFHLKCKKPNFLQSLKEAKMFLSEQKFPRRMIHLQKQSISDDHESGAREDGTCADSLEGSKKNEEKEITPKGFMTFPFQIGDLKIICLGKIVKDPKTLIDEGIICPEGYTAVRMFTSITDPSVRSLYTMEVLRAQTKFRLLFRVTSDNGVQFEGPTPSACWAKIYKEIKKLQNCVSNDNRAENGAEIIFQSGSDMFGLSNPEIVLLIQVMMQELSNSKLSSKLRKHEAEKCLPVGYRPVRVDWKDLDKCSVCHMDEEYENNLFLQCDKCRMMVHARCYGELEPVDGVLWLCNLCRPGAPECTPLCCLCPIIGGAMKPTTDGRWAHLACAIWIPETCLSNIRTMEPIDNLSGIHKDRWKLLCIICGVPYGACIQCSNNSCFVAYHPLCARAAGLCVELEDENEHSISVENEDEHRCIRLLSFCKKHRQPSNERSTVDELFVQVTRQCSTYIPPSNPTGCARSEPYNYIGRRGRKEPEAIEAASLKRLFVENIPYIVSGYSSHESLNNSLSIAAQESSLPSLGLRRLKASEFNNPQTVLSMSEKYKHMRKTFRKRLAFGKSRIHGFGIFAKCSRRAGDMMIEYTGELVRPFIADRRERLIYNSLVGSGTYMFRVGEESVIDATRAGSIAHLINHSCEPNCYSRDICVNGDSHVIIFAKRDIKQWEELTYDYRFFSIDERLPCYCGFPRCRGIVNEREEAEQLKIYAPRTELLQWNGQ